MPWSESSEQRCLEQCCLPSLLRTPYRLGTYLIRLVRFMKDKLLVIIASGDADKVLTALMYAKNAIKYNWIPEVRVVFFGPSQGLLVNNDRVSESAIELAEFGTALACKFISDRDKQSEDIEGMGIEVRYVGEEISELIKNGYTPMVW